MFVTCDNCGRRFHMRPGTTAWTCPACGHEHGSAEMVDLAPEPDLVPEPERVPATVVARHAAPPHAKVKRPPTRGRLVVLAALGMAAVLVASFALSSLGAEKAASPPESPPPTSSSPVDPTEALCLHLRDLQTLREDSLTRLAATLENDATAIEAESKQKLADAVRRMKVAVLAYRDALAAHGDTSAVGAQMVAALSDLPCGATG